MSPTLEAIAEAAYQTLSLTTSKDRLRLLWFLLILEAYGFLFMFFAIAEEFRFHPKNSALREPINPFGARHFAEERRHLLRELPAFKMTCGAVKRILEKHSAVKSTILWKPSRTV